MSKETKLAKKQMKAEKKAQKLEKKQVAQYNKLVKNIEKKNAKLEKKANKKGKPFVPVAIPTMEEAFATGKVNKPANIIKLIILLLLIIYIIYFLVMWFMYVAPTKQLEDDSDDGDTTVAEYDRYVNEHEIFAVPDYDVAEAKALLKQALNDNYRVLGYKTNPSSNAINYTGSIRSVNNADCYEFTASGKTYEVAIDLSSIYQNDNGTYVPVTFHDTNYLDFQNK